MRDLSQHQKIIMTMCVYRKSRDWWRAYDFMKNDLPFDLFVGYEASARISELVGSYPELFEWQKNGKYREIKLRFDNVDKVFHSLPNDFKDVLRECKINNTLF